MPWLALPLGDERKAFLQRRFKIRGIPAVVAIGPSGRTLTAEARPLLQAHGTDAYPFTEEHLKKLDEQMEEMAKGEMGHGWSFYCKVCDFDLHPKCALMKDDPKENGEGHQERRRRDGLAREASAGKHEKA
ncbi:putative nucleoredoxin 1-1 [Camellia lanceoleosa]|uniref:Nucleoredoxin 1-1 n=1 Tax=Camellia lanceoleosa TaxID=1840588 RepID=A0ACC0G7N7_9ERIC|nr:putative nucleoredoxin 1-1 [Camellia lanceoleosa]